MSLIGHTAVVFRDPEEVADRLVPELLEDLERHAVVVAMVDDDVAAALRARLGEREDVRYVPTSEPYSRPVDAVEVLWRVTRDWVAGGGESVTAVGQVGFPGDDRDEEWHWFEAAVNEVLADKPIKGVCLYDESLGDRTVHEACLTHPVVVADEPDLVGAYAGPTAHRPSPPPVPDRPADILFEDFDDNTVVADIRAAVRTAMAEWPIELLDQMLLVMSELVTNSIRHGGRCISTEIWVDEADASIRVVDAGPGIADPYAPLRPPDLGVRGVGLWLCGRETTRFAVTPAPGGGTVATATLHRA